MKKMYLALLLIVTASLPALAQCDLQNYNAAYRIQLADYPYTNAQSITVSAVAINCNPLQNFTYTCGNNSFAGSSPAWWINSAVASITFTFSAPVCNLTVLVNGTNTGEEFYWVSNNGPVNCTNFCTSGYQATNGGTSVLCLNNNSLGTIITANNAAGATTYTLTHNGTGSGSRVTLLDCYVGCNIPPPTHSITCSTPTLGFCVGTNQTVVNYVATGIYTAGNIFTAELSDGFGSFASPTVIGTLASTTSGSINCTIPGAIPPGSNYRVRVVSSAPPVIGSDNGVNIQINAIPTVVAVASPPSICAGSSLTLSGSGAVTYSWSGGVTNAVAFIPPATATYTVTGSDAFGCSNTATVTVPVNPLPVVTASAMPSNSVCELDSVTLNGSGALTYTWTAPVINNTPFVPLSTNTYTVTGTDANNCSNTSTIQVVVESLPLLSITVSPNDTICEGEDVTLTANGASTYSWTGGVQNGVPFSPTSTATYTVVGTNAANCSSSQTQNIVVSPLPIVNLGPDVQLCTGDSIVLNAGNPGAIFLWQNLSSNQTYTAKQNGNYWVTVTKDNCSASDTLIVNVNAYPIINLGPDTSICEGDAIILDATCPGCTYLWNDNSLLPTLSVNQSGLYAVTASRNGCQTTDERDVQVLPLPIVDLGADTTICKGDRIKLDVYRTGAKYLWQNFSTSNTYTITDTGFYWVEVTIGKCTGRDEKVITYSNQCECPVYLPNAFSPNNDSRNDLFRLLGSTNIEVDNFTIYNRWGEVVFETKDRSIGWEGKHKGMECEIGSYYYVVNYRCLYNGKETILKGNVTLVR